MGFRWSGRSAGLALLAVITLPLLGVTVGGAAAEEAGWRTGAAMLGQAKYPTDFKQFDYVNPAAPKGGSLRAGAFGTFDNFNPAIARTRGTLAAGLGLIYESLTKASQDEPFSQYGLIAEAFKFPADFSSVTFRLDPKAAWHDGTPITAEDVVWSFQRWVELDPFYRAYYAHVAEVKETAPGEVTFRFDQAGNRELPMIVGQILILPKHWWTGTRPDGKPRSIGEMTLEPPLGSGPYRIKSFTAAQSITYERVPTYWGVDIPTRVGTNNFDEIRYDYFRDQETLREAFKGGRFDFRAENSAKNWATQYDFPARREGKVKLETFDMLDSGGMQSFTPNLRRDLFKDVRVRQALDLAFDFEELNRTVTYGAYTRTESYFAPMELASSGLPGPKELALLEPLRDKIPPEVFTTVYKEPVNGDPLKVRENLRKALDLLKEAGWQLSGGKLVDKQGRPFSFEILLQDASFEPHTLSFTNALKRLGIDARPVLVDDTQYTERVRRFDFDMVIDTIGQSISPGNEQRNFFSSKSADTPGSDNLAGIKNPAVDALIEKVIFAPDRDGLIAATRALDRVLLWNHYVIPQWYYGKQRLAYWDRFGRPDKLPLYGASGFPEVWWYDADKAAKLGDRP
jgi:microcin C transport system substrate-binding protein